MSISCLGTSVYAIFPFRSCKPSSPSLLLPQVRTVIHAFDVKVDYIDGFCTYWCGVIFIESFDGVVCLAVALQWLVWKKSFDRRVWLSLIPIVGGIVLTSVTELSFNMAGFLAAFFGCVVTSTKTILAESLLHGYNFDRYRILNAT